MNRLFIALLLTCLAAAAWGCAGETQPDSGAGQTVVQAEQPATGDASSGGASSGQSQQASSESREDDDDSEHDDNGDSGEHSSEDKDDDSEHDSKDDATVSRTNPGLIGTGFDAGRNEALFDAQPLDAVTWSVEPTISFGALDAQGTLDEGVELFNPMVDGDGAGFIVYYKDLREPLALLLPDLGPMHVWESYHTIAPMEHEFEGSSFTIRAYSPLFMDVGPDDLVIRVFGYDADGADALLAVAPVGSQ